MDLKKLRPVDSTATEITAAMTRMRCAREKLDEELAELAAARPALLLSATATVQQIDAHDAKQRSVSITLERVVSMFEAAKLELSAAQEREAPKATVYVAPGRTLSAGTPAEPILLGPGSAVVLTADDAARLIRAGFVQLTEPAPTPPPPGDNPGGIGAWQGPVYGS